MTAHLTRYLGPRALAFSGASIHDNTNIRVTGGWVDSNLLSERLHTLPVYTLDTQIHLHSKQDRWLHNCLYFGVSISLQEAGGIFSCIFCKHILPVDTLDTPLDHDSI